MWLGAGAITLGVGAALASGSAVAHADADTSGSASEAGSSASSNGGHNGTSPHRTSIPKTVRSSTHNSASSVSIATPKSAKVNAAGVSPVAAPLHPAAKSLTLAAASRATKFADTAAATVEGSAFAAASSDSATPRHQVTGGELFLGGKYIEVGISSMGSLGTVGAKPDDFYGGNGSNIGLAYEADGLGGTEPRLDFTLPDDPEERWSVGYNDSDYGGFSALNGSAGTATTLTDQTVTDNSSGNTLSGTSQGTVNDALKVRQVQTFDVNSSFYKTTVTLTNVSDSTLTDVEYMRSVDPDNTRAYGGSNKTINAIGGQYASEGSSLVTATSLPGDSYDAVTGHQATMLYYSDDPNAIVYTGGFSNSNPYAYDSLGQTKDYSESADQAIGIIFKKGDLAPGQSVTFSYYTAVATDANVADIVKQIGADSKSTRTLNGLFDSFLNPATGVFSQIAGLAGTMLDVIGDAGPATAISKLASGALGAFSLVTSAIQYSEGVTDQESGRWLSGSLETAAGTLGIAGFGGAVVGGAVGLATGVGIAAGLTAAAPVLVPVAIGAAAIGGAAWLIHSFTPW